MVPKLHLEFDYLIIWLPSGTVPTYNLTSDHIIRTYLVRRSWAWPGLAWPSAYCSLVIAESRPISRQRALQARTRTHAAADLPRRVVEDNLKAVRRLNWLYFPIFDSKLDLLLVSIACPSLFFGYFSVRSLPQFFLWAVCCLARIVVRSPRVYK